MPTPKLFSDNHSEQIVLHLKVMGRDDFVGCPPSRREGGSCFRSARVGRTHKLAVIVQTSGYSYKSYSSVNEDEIAFLCK